MPTAGFRGHERRRILQPLPRLSRCQEVFRAEKGIFGGYLMLKFCALNAAPLESVTSWHELKLPFGVQAGPCVWGHRFCSGRLWPTLLFGKLWSSTPFSSLSLPVRDPTPTCPGGTLIASPQGCSWHPLRGSHWLVVPSASQRGAGWHRVMGDTEEGAQRWGDVRRSSGVGSTGGGHVATTGW